MNRGEAVGKAIAELRSLAGLSQAELSRRCSIAQPTISRIENGEFSPSMISLLDIAEGLGVTPDVIFQKAGVIPPKETTELAIREIDRLVSSLSPGETEMLKDFGKLLRDRRAKYQTAADDDN